MTNEKIKNLIDLGFDEKWLKDILSFGDDIKFFDDMLELFKPKTEGKYKIRIFECDDLDQEPDSGISVISCFFDDERDLSIIHHFFEGMFYIMNVVSTDKELGRGIIDGAPFEEIEEFEETSWNWLMGKELGPGFAKREKEREEYIEKYNSSLQEKESFSEMARTIDRAVGFISSIFGELIDSDSEFAGGWEDYIEPLMAVSDKLKARVKK